MGGRLSPILANLFMEHLEYSVLCTTPIVPKAFFRYVDDILLIWDQARGSYREFLRLMNLQHPAIVLTEEREENRTLAFLDILIKRPLIDENAQTLEPLQISIYRKPTHSNRYLHFNSAHPLSLKQNVVHGLWLRAQRILKNFPKELKSELQFLQDSLAHDNNAYPRGLLMGWFAKFLRQIRKNPASLKVKSRLAFSEVFENWIQQKFEMPTANTRFGTSLDMKINQSPTSEEPEEGERIPEEGF